MPIQRFFRVIDEREYKILKEYLPENKYVTTRRNVIIMHGKANLKGKKYVVFIKGSKDKMTKKQNAKDYYITRKPYKILKIITFEDFINKKY